MRKALLITAIAALAAAPLAWAQSSGGAGVSGTFSVGAGAGAGGAGSMVGGGGSAGSTTLSGGGSAATGTLNGAGTVAPAGTTAADLTGGPSGMSGATDTTLTGSATAVTGQSASASARADANPPAGWTGTAQAWSAHSQACASRYRTYDPATNMYYVRPGVQQRCSLSSGAGASAR